MRRWSRRGRRGTGLEFRCAASSSEVTIIGGDASFDHVIALPNSITIAR